MRHILIIERWVPAAQIYIERYEAVLSENDILYPDQIGAANRLLRGSNGVTFELTQGVTMPDGWSYYKSQALPVVTPPVVVLPTNVETFPTPETVPGDYEIRCKVVKQF